MSGLGRPRAETAVRRLRWKSDFEKKCLVVNFDRRGWRKTMEDEDEYWNLYWASKGTHLSSVMMRLGEDQMVNHFPNHFELTRKDLLVKNLKFPLLHLISNLHGPGNLQPHEHLGSYRCIVNVVN